MIGSRSAIAARQKRREEFRAQMAKGVAVLRSEEQQEREEEEEEDGYDT